MQSCLGRAAFDAFALVGFVSRDLVNIAYRLEDKLIHYVGEDSDHQFLYTIKASAVNLTEEWSTPDHSCQLLCDMWILNEIRVEYEAAHAMAEQEKW